MNIDLHSHSLCSDGTLRPADLVARAVDKGVDALALTDHDTVSGIEEAAAAARAQGLQLVPGVEISVTWSKRVLHVVGLWVDPTAAALCDGLRWQSETRATRAQGIGERLQAQGVRDAYERAKEMAAGGNVTRTHFARLIVIDGLADNEGQAFDKYLSQGKSAWVRSQWASLEQALAWIHGAGGRAVIAHPSRYKMTHAMMRELLKEFREAGGDGLEVVVSGLDRNQIRHWGELSKRFELCASRGSDFHNPDFPWIELGRLPPLPPDLAPVWHQLL